MSAPQVIVDLVEHFASNADVYRKNLNETEVRVQFIDPFFEALGWDIHNKQHYAETYKDVVHEYSMPKGPHTEAPDYCFRVGGTRKFFVEAKRPAIHLAVDPAPAFQLRSYAWTSKLPLSLLTNFAEFAVYDCRKAPDPKDKASVARIDLITFDQYTARWDDIAVRFSKEAVYKGSFDRYTESSKLKKGTAEVDDAFLAEIESWRKELASNIALRNPSLTQREVNFAVQRTIDRIIFLRICEDRGIEKYGQLQEIQQGEHIYERLVNIYVRADEKYNSGLFHFSQEKNRAEEPDKLTPRLKIDDIRLRAILKRLYYPDSPYRFSHFPADILGQVYEQFLGQVIRLTPGHQAKVEPKPEVKKAGGVYYTPTYIVDYIVRNTVGKLLEGKTPKQASKLRILDPACGSGSFLIGAYQYLLNWHRDRYLEDGAEKHKKELYQVAGGEWRLATAEKKRILLNNIYGADIDSQAVEVTKLSLLLKVLEGESEQTLAAQLRLFHERALPDLGNNIKCGNSLVGTDFYQNQQMRLIDEEERYRVNAFDWQKEFTTIMQAGGFDAVIGNPPYGALLSESEAEYLRTKFGSRNVLDSYALFLEQALRLCRSLGKISMIVPTGWYSGAGFAYLRRLIACTGDPESFVNLPYDIFKAWVDTTVFVLIKREQLASWPRTAPQFVKLKTFPKRHRITSASELDESTGSANFSEWFGDGCDEYLTYADSAETAIIQKVKASGRPLQEFSDVQRGVTPFLLTKSPTHASSRRAFSGAVRRYQFERGECCYIRFDNTLAEPKPGRYFQGPRLLLRELISRQFRLQAVKVTDDFVTNKSLQSILALPGGPDLNYLLACLNSRLMSWFFLHLSSIAQRDDFPKIVLKETRSLPIPPLDGNPSRQKVHDDLVCLVETMLSLQSRVLRSRTEQERSVLQRQVDATDRQIDQLVYQLYGLTDEEIAIVENSGPQTKAATAKAPA
ncbi:MAG: Eco57I restriction-modification methylase domain-containing protein [Terriglobales bacterium]